VGGLGGGGHEVAVWLCKSHVLCEADVAWELGFGGSQGNSGESSSRGIPSPTPAHG
jgi:hypothetical protein